MSETDTHQKESGLNGSSATDDEVNHGAAGGRKAHVDEEPAPSGCDPTVCVRNKVQMASRHGPVRVVWFRGLPGAKEHYAMIFGDPLSPGSPARPLVRIHSECFTADQCDSLHCDCGHQLAEAKRRCSEEGRGIIIMMCDEGRGIGRYAKLEAYKLQIEKGFDTFEANRALGLPADARDFTLAADMLRAMGVTSVRLLTNNPAKVAGLEAGGIAVEMVPTDVQVTPENRRYLEAKRRLTNHTICLDPQESQ